MALPQKRILIVDDVTFVRNTLREILTDAGYQIAGEAADGAEAVQLYSELKPDLVTMDVVMPHMSGIDATRKIIKADPEARVIIISAMGQENLVMEAVNVGAKSYILKPFTSAEVVSTVERTLSDQDSPLVNPVALDLSLNSSAKGSGSAKIS